MKPLHVAVIIPYLNEEKWLSSTCASLGFGAGQNPTSETSLILVDNDSTDHTATIAMEIQKHSPCGTVILECESERGYVPPRRCGNFAARNLAQRLGRSEDEVLILQADADTIYGPNYVETMRTASGAAGTDVILEARTAYSSEFKVEYADYLALCDSVDQEFESLLAYTPDEIILDDKAVGYRLADYFMWGGHRREYLTNGDEIHAETTRLYMRAKTFDARIFPVDEASVIHSERKVLAGPMLDFVTAGFPREKSWVNWWLQNSMKHLSMNQLLRDLNSLPLNKEILWRKRHLLAIFGILPLHVTQTLEHDFQLKQARLIGKDVLPKRNMKTLRNNPSVLINDAFATVNALDESTISEWLVAFF